MLTKLHSNIGAIWCNLAHKSVMWPVHGQYQCRACGRRYPAFEELPIAGWTNETTAVSDAVNPHRSTSGATA